MSGVVGWVDFQRDLLPQRHVVESMTKTVQNRGPDSEGVWVSRTAAIGHRGLVTTEWAAAGQPVREQVGDADVSLAVAGHVDNAADLSRALPRSGRPARTAADVLLRAYLAWGDAFVERLDGVFGFALWDGRTRRLLLGRDRLGVKPLYYFGYPGGVVFGSEPKAIMANPRFEARLDPRAVPILLQPRLALPGETPLVGLREVPPAHLLTFSGAGVRQRRYWRLTSRHHTDSFADTGHHVRRLLSDAVSRQTAGVGRLGAMLSGGLDSTAVAALASRRSPDTAGRTPLHTYCIRFDSDPAHFVATELRPDVDASYALAAAESLGTRHVTLTATMPDLLDAVPATRDARDLPGWGQFDASMYLLFRRMRRDCAVALTGEAADEIFGGYPYFFKPEIRLRPGFPWMFDGPKLSDCLSPELTAIIDPRQDERARYAQLIASVPRLPGEDAENARMRELFFLGMSGPLSVILDRKERMSMAHGLDVRVPFCDHRIVEYVWNVPWSMKCRGGVKGLLKAAMADLLPPSTLDRRKSAYPHVQNPAYDRLLVDQASRAVNDKDSPVAWMFDADRMNGLIEQIAANELRAELPGGSNPAAMLIQLVEMRQWMEKYNVSVS